MSSQKAKDVKIVTVGDGAVVCNYVSQVIVIFFSSSSPG